MAEKVLLWQHLNFSLAVICFQSHQINLRLRWHTYTLRWPSPWPERLACLQEKTCPKCWGNCKLSICKHVWVNCDVSLTWNKAILGMISLTNHDSSEVAVRSRSNLPRFNKPLLVNNYIPLSFTIIIYQPLLYYYLPTIIIYHCLPFNKPFMWFQRPEAILTTHPCVGVKRWTSLWRTLGFPKIWRFKKCWFNQDKIII